MIDTLSKIPFKGLSINNVTQFLNDFGAPCPIFTLLSAKAIVIASQNHRPLPPSFMVIHFLFLQKLDFFSLGLTEIFRLNDAKVLNHPDTKVSHLSNILFFELLW